MYTHCIMGRIDICTDMSIHMYGHMCKDMSINMCKDMSIHMF